MEKEKVTKEEAKKLEKERYEELVAEEKRISQEAQKTASIASELLPPIIKDDGFGNEMPHILIDGAYVPQPIANVQIQEKKLVMEYHRLEELKEEMENYLEVRKKAKKEREKNNK